MFPAMINASAALLLCVSWEGPSREGGIEWRTIELTFDSIEAVEPLSGTYLLPVKTAPMIEIMSAVFVRLPFSSEFAYRRITSMIQGRRCKAPFLEVKTS